ncbi:MAG: restriction endonuclease subunit S, partial [Isosphaeraceae bacterium]
IATIKSGKRLPMGHTLTSQRTQHPYIRLVDVHDHRIRSGNMQYLKDNTQKAISKYIVRSGDVCLAIVGHTIGLVFTVGKHWDGANLTENAARLTDFRGADAGFVFNCLRSPNGQALIRSRTVGSAQGKLPLYAIAELPITLPPLSEQEAIAQILGSLDDKIDLNRRMNETLEAMARAIFKSWFVDFDPVRAKMEGRQPVGIDAETAALFPDSFEESDLGEMPIGWEPCRVGDVADVNGWTLGGKDALDHVRYIEISEVMRGEIFSIAEYTRGSEPSRARRRLRHGDTVLSTVRPDRGAYFLCLNPDESLIASTGFAVITPKKVPWSFAFAALAREEILQELGHLADGGAYPAVRPEVIANRDIITPGNPRILEQFHVRCEPLYLRVDASRRESKSLAAIRDALLPKLLSGEIHVKDAENTVEAHL